MCELESRELPAVMHLFPVAKAHGHVSNYKTAKASGNSSRFTLNTITYQPDGQLLTIVAPGTAAQPPVGGWPVLFAVHGGGWYRFDRNQIIAGLGSVPGGGVAIVAADYALAKSNQDSWPDNLNDLANALDWVLQHGAEYGLDTNKITLMGQSAGGHLAALLAIHESGRLDANGGPLVDGLVSVSGPMNLPGLVGESAFATNKAQAMLGASYDKAPAQWQAASPEWQLQANQNINMPPTLIIHGTADPVVPVDQSVAFQDLLTKRKTQATLVEIDKAGHELLKGQFAKKVQALILNFVTSLRKSG